MPNAVISKFIPLREVGEPGGVVNFCSWHRLEGLLRTAGEVKPSESVKTFVIQEGGIKIVFEGRD